MTSTQQQCFLEAAECLNFTAASEKLYISQPALSRNIAALEEELELLLFIRRNNVLSLTPGGPSSVNAAITTDYFGPRHSGSIYGVILLALGASSLFFNSVSARVLGGDVSATFMMAAFSALVPLLLMGLLHIHGALEKRSLSLQTLWPRRTAHGGHGA